MSASTATRAVRGLLVFSAVAYSAWLLELILPTDIDPLRDFVSDLGALDHRYGFLFRTTDLVAGGAAIAAAVVGAVWLRRGWLATLAWLGMGVFGVGTVLDSRFPIRCTTECRTSPEAIVDGLTSLHGYTSTMAATGVVIGGLAMLAKGFHDHWPARMLAAEGAVITGFLIGGGWQIAATAAAGNTDRWIGAGQRVQVAAIAGWVLYAAWAAPRMRGAAHETTDRS